jgi:hypothetical protein
MMKAGSKNRSRMRILKSPTTIPNVLSEGTHMKFSASHLRNVARLPSANSSLDPN